MSKPSSRHRATFSRADPTVYRTITPDGGRLSDIYHYLLTVSWPLLLLVIGVLFVATNAIFACLYFVSGGIENARPGSFSDAFFFSVQTMATIGYGKMAPASEFTNIVMTVEAFSGLLALATVTGLVFAKFSRPTARVRFSSIAVVSKREGVPSLMFRMANMRGNRIVEATVHVVFARQELTLEGEDVRKFYDLPLTRIRNVIFTYSWTVVHPVTKDSPLYGESTDSMEKSIAEVIVSLIGLDDSFAQTVHARHSYRPRNIIWGARLADILERTPEGMTIDYSRFDKFERVA